MARRMNPVPAGHSRNRAVGWQRLDLVAQIYRVLREETGDPGHHPAFDRWVRGGIFALASQERQLESMGIDWDAPVADQLDDRGNMIEVTVGQHDRAGPRVRSEALLGILNDRVGGARHAG